MLAQGMRILLVGQTTPIENGIFPGPNHGSMIGACQWVVNGPTRAGDMATNSHAAGAVVFSDNLIQSLTTNAITGLPYICTSQIPDDCVGVNNLTFERYCGAAGDVQSVVNKAYVSNLGADAASLGGTMAAAYPQRMNHALFINTCKKDSNGIPYLYLDQGVF